MWPTRRPSTLTLIGAAAILVAFAVARVAQWIERLPPEQEAAGSNPAAGIHTEGPLSGRPFSSVRPAGRTHLGVKVPY